MLWTPNWWPADFGTSPTPKSCLKNLGVRLEQTLTMKEHANQIAGSCFHVLGLLRRILPLLPDSTRKMLTQALVLSRLDYCNGLLLSANEAALNKLQVIQNTAARLVLNAPARTASRPLLYQLQWLPIRERVRFKVCCIIHKALANIGPSYLIEKFHPYIPQRSLRTSSQSLLVIPRAKRARQGEKSLACRGPRLWNALPLHLRQCTEHLHFRKLLKTFLFCF